MEKLLRQQHELILKFQVENAKHDKLIAQFMTGANPSPARYTVYLRNFSLISMSKHLSFFRNFFSNTNVS